MCRELAYEHSKNGVVCYPDLEFIIKKGTLEFQSQDDCEPFQCLKSQNRGETCSALGTFSDSELCTPEFSIFHPLLNNTCRFLSEYI